MKIPSTIIILCCIIFSSCSVFKVSYVDKKDIVGEWLIAGVAMSDRSYQNYTRRVTMTLYENDSCVFTTDDVRHYESTYKLDGNYLTIYVKPGWIERYQIITLRNGRMEISAKSEQSNFVWFPGGYLWWRKQGEI